MMSDIAQIRLEYRHGHLREQEIDADPIVQFQRWFDEAVTAELALPNAMVLATATADGRPSARYVLLKGISEGGFIFYTHSVSAKGQQLAANPQASLVFYWEPLHRQVRIDGIAEMLPAAATDEYFQSRPRGSQISVWVAPQSEEVASRDFLEARYAELAEQYADQETVPRPETWAGYRVKAELIEFWQGCENRLHDRIEYRLLDSGAWRIRRLAP